MVDPEAVLLPGTELAEGVGADTDLEWVGDLRADHADRPARRARGDGVRLEDSDLRIALDQVDRRGHTERAGADDHDVGFGDHRFSGPEGLEKDSLPETRSPATPLQGRSPDQSSVCFRPEIVLPPAIRVARELKATDVINVLSDLLILRGVPGHIRLTVDRSS
jgi:hypothetical protein